MSRPTVLAFAGSTRTESLNKKLVRVAAAAADAAGADVTVLDLRELPMPLYDGDLEAREGLPVNAKTFKDALLAHQGLLIASPEYNSSMTAVFKNAIDWASRPATSDEAPLACFKGKVAAIMSASPGSLGGLRSLVHVRAMLGNIGVLVLPEQVAIPKAHEAFAPDGGLVDARKRAQVEGLGMALVTTLTKLGA